MWHLGSDRITKEKEKSSKHALRNSYGALQYADKPVHCISMITAPVLLADTHHFTVKQFRRIYATNIAVQREEFSHPFDSDFITAARSPLKDVHLQTSWSCCSWTPKCEKAPRVEPRRFLAIKLSLPSTDIASAILWVSKQSRKAMD
jgi:hypothetical protein